MLEYTVKTIASVLAIMLVIIAAKVIGNFSGKQIATENTKDLQSTHNEKLKWFVNEFAVNNINYHYPIKINEEMYLINKSIIDEDRSMFVLENYRLNAPATASPIEIKAAEESTREQVRNIFCESLQERERLFTGYSSVGIIQKITDANGKLLFNIKIEKSQCI